MQQNQDNLKKRIQNCEKRLVTLKKANAPTQILANEKRMLETLKQMLTNLLN